MVLWYSIHITTRCGYAVGCSGWTVPNSPTHYSIVIISATCNGYLCSLGAGVTYQMSYCWYVSEFNYRSGWLSTSGDLLICLKYKTECSNILLLIRYIEHEKWVYFTVKIIRNYFACNKNLNKNENCKIINKVKIYIKINNMVIRKLINWCFVYVMKNTSYTTTVHHNLLWLIRY